MESLLGVLPNAHQAPDKYGYEIKSKSKSNRVSLMTPTADRGFEGDKNNTFRQFMERYGVSKGYVSHVELLQDEEVDAVAITLGHQLHHKLTVDSCNAGKHVLVEKPMAISLEQCDDMIVAAASPWAC